MPRPPEIGNVRLYPDRPLKASDRNGYVLKFYCPIRGKRIRKSAGTRERREARRILRECRERLLNGEYSDSGGAITAEQAATRTKIIAVMQEAPDLSTMGWEDCYQRYKKHYEARNRDKSTADAISRLSISERILQTARQERGLPEDGPIGEFLNLDSLEYLQERLLEGDEGMYESRSPTTTNSALTAVMAFARYCFRHGWIPNVPPVTKLSVDDVMKGRPIREAEFEEMLEATADVVGKRAAGRWRFILQIIWESGFRIGDCLDFSWDDQRHIHPKWPNREGELPTLLIPATQKNKKSQEVPMLPGLQELLNTVPADDRTGWVIHPLPPSKNEKSFRPLSSDLQQLVERYSNSAIAEVCYVTEAAVRKWLAQEGLELDSRATASGQRISGEDATALRDRAEHNPKWIRAGKEHRPTKGWVGDIISQIGEKAGIVVQLDDPSQGKRLKYASAHDIRRGCAQRLINVGVSAETLKLVMRHKDFATTERYYGATREAQSAAAELADKLAKGGEKNDLKPESNRIDGLTAEEIAKLKSLLNSI